MKKMTSLLCALFCGAFLPFVASAETYQVKDDVLTMLDAGDMSVTKNNDAHFAELSGTATLKLTQRDGVAYPGNYLVYTRITVKSGCTLEVQLVDSKTGNPVEGVKDVQFANGIWVEKNATVKFPSNLRYALVGRQSVGLTGWPLFNVEGTTEFANKEGRYVVTQYVTLRQPPTGWKPGLDTVWKNATIALQGSNPLGIDSSKPFDMTHYDILALTWAAIPANSTINVPVGRTLGFRPSAAKQWGWSNENWVTAPCRVNLAGKGARVLFRNADGSSYIRSQADICGTGEIEVRTEGGGTYAGQGNFRCYLNGLGYVSPLKAGASLVIPVRERPAPVFTDDWKQKVSHWLDASKPGTLVKYAAANKPDAMRYEYQGKYDVIVGWTDAVKDPKDGDFLYNRDAMNGNNPQYLPYVVPNGLNGMSYVSFGRQNNDAATVDDADHGTGSTTEKRWLRFVPKSTNGCPGNTKPIGGYTTIPDKFVIMVIGSQNGGGKAILDTVKPASGNKGNPARTSSATNQVWMYYDEAGYQLAVDGLWTQPHRAYPTGGWQILSVEVPAEGTIKGLGAHQSPDPYGIPSLGLAGGMNYAELIFFKQRPSEEDRLACEAYLAKKWGLAGYAASAAHQTVATVSGPADARVEILEATTLTAEGDFKGEFSVDAGKKLVIANLPKPPTEKDVPSANRVGWFDPSYAGAIDEKPNVAGGVARLFNRTVDGLLKNPSDLWFGGQYNSAETKIGRYPFKATGPRTALATAPSMTWLDFTQNPPEEASLTGNTLRLHQYKDVDGGVYSTANEKMTIREGYMALDTSLGGGSPIGCDVGFTGVIKHRECNDFTKPIWSANDTVKMAKTYLNDKEVDATKGFTGIPEILTFTTAANLDLGFMGYYNSSGQKNYEIIGESLFYSAPLSDRDRATVQDYLMYKWLGDLNGKYSDLSHATVKGAGTVEASGVEQLPQPTKDFTGVMSVTGASTFDLTAETLVIAASLTFAETASVVATADVKLTAGDYTLVTVPEGKTLTVPAALLGKTKVTLTGAIEKMKGKLKLSEDQRSLVLDLHSRGLSLILR